MLQIQLAGSSRERGRAQGEAFRTEIHELFELSTQYFMPNMKKGPSDTILERMLQYTSEHEPELIEELEGISEAAGLTTKELFLMNSASAISSIGPNCTNVAVSRSQDGPLYGKTSDIGIDYKYYMLQVTTTEDCHRFIGIGWVGSVWIEVGLNDYGLAVGQSSGPIAPNQDGFGIPTLVCPRPVLSRCRSVQEAVNYLATRHMAGKGLNLMLMDREGASVVVEKSGTYQQVRESLDHVLFCTNHYLSDEMKDFKDFNLSGIRENSMARFNYLSGLTLDRPEGFNVSQMQSLLRSHEGSICQHNDPNLTTHYAYVIAPRQLTFMITDGNPCENEFQIYQM